MRCAISWGLLASGHVIESGLETVDKLKEPTAGVGRFGLQPGIYAGLTEQATEDLANIPPERTNEKDSVVVYEDTQRPVEQLSRQ